MATCGISFSLRVRFRREDALPADNGPGRARQNMSKVVSYWTSRTGNNSRDDAQDVAQDRRRLLCVAPDDICHP
jgi:hypothetical protein